MIWLVPPLDAVSLYGCCFLLLVFMLCCNLYKFNSIVKCKLFSVMLYSLEAYFFRKISTNKIQGLHKVRFAIRTSSTVVIKVGENEVSCPPSLG